MIQITQATKITHLNKTQITELQTLLSNLGLYRSAIDGICGSLTSSAWHQFKQNHHQNDLDAIGLGSVKLLLEAAKIDWSTAKGTRLGILAECNRQGLTLANQKAYVLATVQWETANTWKPVKEAYWLSESWRKANLRYYPYYGRGYVQLTWLFNYLKYGRILNLNLAQHPDLALDPKIAAFILVHGFKHGTFTGMSLDNYVNSSKTDWNNARRCINGMDKANTHCVHEVRRSLADPCGIASYAANWVKFV